VPDLQVTVANQITTSAEITALTIEEAIINMQLAGMSKDAIKLTLITDLKEGGILFGTFRNKLKNTVRNAVELSSNGSANSAFTKAGVQEYQWISVGDGKVCPDCEERHGESGTMEFFETIGLPASGFSVCTTNCRCQLVPSNYKGENLDKPLVKQKN
jgi:SPP1 gp7 family putative phage head morphogenesis protein